MWERDEGKEERKKRRKRRCEEDRFMGKTKVSHNIAARHCVVYSFQSCVMFVCTTS